jgi:two-component system, OmpR family, response regulator
MQFTKPKKVFIVDDDQMVRQMMEDKLKSFNHHVTSFSNGEDCLHYLSENPDVVVLDYHLDKSIREAANGLQILEAIKKNYPNVHVIMLSSQEKYSLALQTIQKGAEQYVIKDNDAFDKIAGIIAGLK